MSNAGLDYAFLQYFGVTAEAEQRFHAFYLSLLQDYERILDLGSGFGGFVKLLCDAGKDAFGVDSDPGCVAESRRLGAPVVEADVLEYLRAVEPNSLDAIFSAHLVEHLPYDVVLQVVRLSHRALRPDGRLLLVTPNPRALVSHLELYHQHFGHVALYQPELLAFFMAHCGFASTQIGENPETTPDKIAPHSALASAISFQPSAEPYTSILPRPHPPLRRLIWYPKQWLIHWLVQPYTDRLYGRLLAAEAQLQRLAGLMGQPFECYAAGDKAGDKTEAG